MIHRLIHGHWADWRRIPHPVDGRPWVIYSARYCLACTLADTRKDTE
jgi:hypothetical protein